MKQVQDALASLIQYGIPVSAGIWRTTDTTQNPPPQYIVYSSTTNEDAHSDDRVDSYRTYVYMNLWSVDDPTATAALVRKLMYQHGFGMLEETDKGYNQPAYDTAVRLFTIGWTWVWREDVVHDAD